MPIFSWGTRRQLAIFAVFAAIVIAAVFAAIYFLKPQPTCFDNRQNQDEEGVDCGGSHCIPCSEQVRNVTILWSRFFQVRPGFYDVAAMLENDNQFLKAKNFVYAVKLYDESNVVLAIREGSTFINPGEKFVVFETGLETHNRIPKKAIVEIRSVDWKKAEAQQIKIDITKKDLHLLDFPPNLAVTISNAENVVKKNIEIYAVLYGAEDNALGVSKTVVDQLGIGETKDITFTWPAPIEGVLRAEVLIRQAP